MNKRFFIDRSKLIIAGLIVLAFAIRMIPHLMVYRWIACEEELVYRVVDDLIVLGKPREGYNLYNPLTTYGIYYIHILSKIDPVFLCQIFNPLVGALTVIPLYLLAKKLVDIKGALITSLLYTFSEVAVYREASFGSVEPIGIFFAVATLYFYSQISEDKKSYGWMGVCYFLTFLGHVLPFVWLTGVLFLDSLIRGNKKMKIAMLSLTVTAILVMYSPFLPYKAVQTLIEPSVLLGNINLSNLVNLYSIRDLAIIGLGNWAGSAILILGFFLSIFYEKKSGMKRLEFSMFLSALLLFGFTYLSYNSFLVSPVRYILYLVFPSMIVVSKFIEKVSSKQLKSVLVFLIVLSMLACLPQGFERVLWTPYSLTKAEYDALDQIRPLIVNTFVWYADYPATVSILAHSNKTFLITRQISTSSLPTWIDQVRSNTYLQNITTRGNLTEFDKTGFNYVFLSERMQRNALFLQFKAEGGRNTYFHLPIKDIWQNSTNWEIIYDENGVKVYGRVTS